MAKGNLTSCRQLLENDLPDADDIMRLAFGTFLGLPEPRKFLGDADFVKTRWLADPTASFGADINGKLVGSNFATDWGSFGFFGPLTVNPDFWDRGIAKVLIEPVVELFDEWGVRSAGLFTFSHSPKHIGLYQKFGFSPRFLTAVLSKSVAPGTKGLHGSRYSTLTETERIESLAACVDLTDRIYEGLDVTREIRAVLDQKLGDTILLWEESGLVGFAVCHVGEGTEAGSDTCYVKFAAICPGPNAGQNFEGLLDVSEALAASRGASRLVAGVNTSREQAYVTMLASGFRLTPIIGVAMQRPNNEAYNRADVFVIDDWR